LPEAECPAGERNTALVALPVALAIATLLLALAMTGTPPKAPPQETVPTANQPGPADAPGSAVAPGEQRELVTAPAPERPVHNENPGGAPPGEGGDSGALSGADRPDSSYGFTIEQVTEEVAGAPTTLQEVSSTDAGGSGGEGGTGNGEGTGNGDGRGPGEFMGIPASGKDIVFVIDWSGSMGENRRIHHAKLELRRSIESLGPENRFLVVMFNTDATTLGGDRLVAADARGKQRAFRELARIDERNTNGATDPASAMRLALQLEPDTIFLMTDGDFDADATFEVIESLNARREVTINAIAFHYDVGEVALRAIAGRNGGTYRFVPAPGGKP
jgi:hypothetical protein